VHALGSVSLNVELGEIVAVIGGSGSGKSTLLRAIGGLDPPSDGAILLDGEKIVAPHEKIGIIFQEPRLPWLKVADNVGFGLSGRPKSERTARIAAALKRVGLADKAAGWPRELSGGQAQRARWCRVRKCCCSTNRSRRSTLLPAPICRTICLTCGPTPGRP